MSPVLLLVPRVLAAILVFVTFVLAVNNVSEYNKYLLYDYYYTPDFASLDPSVRAAYALSILGCILLLIGTAAATIQPKVRILRFILLGASLFAVVTYIIFWSLISAGFTTKRIAEETVAAGSGLKKSPYSWTGPSQVNVRNGSVVAPGFVGALILAATSIVAIITKDSTTVPAAENESDWEAQWEQKNGSAPVTMQPAVMPQAEHGTATGTGVPQTMEDIERAPEAGTVEPADTEEIEHIPKN